MVEIGDFEAWYGLSGSDVLDHAWQSRDIEELKTMNCGTVVEVRCMPKGKRFRGLLADGGRALLGQARSRCGGINADRKKQS